jgi:hypothetical protein
MLITCAMRVLVPNLFDQAERLALQRIRAFLVNLAPNSHLRFIRRQSK